jgi:NAD+ synthase (glutamine-hydrolysing)
MRSDLRPFLLPPQYESYPFKRIDELVEKIERYEKEKGDS